MDGENAVVYGLHTDMEPFIAYKINSSGKVRRQVLPAFLVANVCAAIPETR
jgi:uncharacterized protein with GYD domain